MQTKDPTLLDAAGGVLRVAAVLLLLGVIGRVFWEVLKFGWSLIDLWPK